jgi:DNA-binding CsgD family transcriptional regulator
MGRRGRPPHQDILTPREWEVLDLLRERLTNEQIADRLGITLDGAKYHVSEILSKLGVGTREEAGRWRPTDTQPWWLRLITPPAAAKIAGGLTLLGAAAGLALLAWGVAETGGPPHTSESIGPTPSVVLADCKDSMPVPLDGSAACAFGFEANDVPARLQAYPLQVEPERTNVFGDISLYATCAPEGSCLSFATGEPVTEERASGIDWRIEGSATIVIASPETVETDSIPAREYRFIDFAYDHPADRICTAELLYCYTFVANYGQVRPSLTVAPTDTGAPVPAGMERFPGVTMTFDYPNGWVIGRSIRPYFNSDRGDENVSLHNFDPATGPPRESSLDGSRWTLVVSR